MCRNIILLFGGTSDERMVSVASAQSMAHAIGSVTLWFWHKNGSVYLVPYSELTEHQDAFTNEFIPQSRPLFPSIEEAIRSEQSRDQVFLLGLHGGAGENGDIQKLLEQSGRKFTGSKSRPSQIAFDKIATKNTLEGYRIKMAPHKLLADTHKLQIQQTVTEFFETHAHSIIKPVAGGSSLGCHFINSYDEIEAAVEYIIAHSSQPFFIEKIIKGRELTVGVVENHSGLSPLPCTEIVVEQTRSFDYEGKYLGMGTKEITPADISENTLCEAQRMAIAAHAALLLDGYSRTDMILAHDGLYFLETNTLPGLTRKSLVTQQLAEAGISMREFLLQQIELAQHKRF